MTDSEKIEYFRLHPEILTVQNKKLILDDVYSSEQLKKINDYINSYWLSKFGIYRYRNISDKMEVNDYDIRNETFPYDDDDELIPDLIDPFVEDIRDEIFPYNDDELIPDLIDPFELSLHDEDQPDDENFDEVDLLYDQATHDDIANELFPYDLEPVESCQIDHSRYHEVCDIVWNARCSGSNSPHLNQRIKESADKCGFLRDRWEKKCYKPKNEAVRARHHGAIEKMHKIINNCDKITGTPTLMKFDVPVPVSNPPTLMKFDVAVPVPAPTPVTEDVSSKNILNSSIDKLVIGEPYQLRFGNSYFITAYLQPIVYILLHVGKTCQSPEYIDVLGNYLKRYQVFNPSDIQNYINIPIELNRKKNGIIVNISDKLRRKNANKIIDCMRYNLPNKDPLKKYIGIYMQNPQH